MSYFNNVEDVLGKIVDTDKVELRTYKDSSNRTVIKLTCLKCGKQRDILWKRFNYRGATLCDCSDMKRESYKDYIGTEYQGYTIKSIDYNAEPKQIVLKCNKCGFEKTQGAKNVIKKIRNKMVISGCTECARIKRLQTYGAKDISEYKEKYKSYIGKIYDTDTVKDIVKGNGTSIMAVVKCNICGRDRNIGISAITIGNYNRVGQCDCKKYRELYYKQFIGMSCFEDTIVGFGINKTCNEAYFVLKCNQCGEKRIIQGSNRMAGVIRNCKLKIKPKNLGYKMCNCVKGTREVNTVDRYNNLINKQLEGTLLTLLQITKNKDNKLVGTFRCECGNICNKSFHSVKFGHTVSCGCLNRKSYGEKIVADILNELKIEYRSEVTLADLRNDRGNRLRFDFVLKLSDTEYGIIEYDGEQHYDIRQCDFEYHTIDEDAFRNIQRNDKIKDDYCEKHGYKILRLRDKYYKNNKEAIKSAIKTFFGI